MSGMSRGAGVDAVIKVGGALLQLDGALGRIAGAVTVAARAHRLLVVPGGGVFADTVRAVDRDARAAGAPLGDDAAHWMAVLAIDQYAQMLAARIPGAELADAAQEVRRTLDTGRIPVLAPYRWLRAADPLPHSWDVTSDSIAAWVAGAVGAATLVLVKGASGTVEALTDPYFARAKPDGVRTVVLAAGDVDGLANVLS